MPNLSKPFHLDGSSVCIRDVVLCGKWLRRLLVCEWENRLPTDNGYRLPGKAQTTPDANIFTAAASWPETDKILHTEEHHEHDLLPKIWRKEADEGEEKNAGKEKKKKKRNQKQSISTVPCLKKVNQHLNSCFSALTTCHNNSLRSIDYIHRDTIHHALICATRPHNSSLCLQNLHEPENQQC